MNRRAFVSVVAAGAASTLIQGTAAVAQRAPKARNVVLVHGLFAERVMLVRGDCTIAGSGAQCHSRAKSQLGVDEVTLSDNPRLVLPFA